MAHATDPDFGPIGARLGYQLRRLDVLSMTSLAQMLATIGLTPARATALVYVGLHAACDQTALGRALGINRASTMATVNALVAIGAIERRTGRDRRTNALRLSTEGERLRDQAERLSEEHDRAVFAALDPGERATLSRLIQKTRATQAPRPRLDCED